MCVFLCFKERQRKVKKGNLEKKKRGMLERKAEN